ncbi:MAG TPA: VanW family protein [Candidatus Limnocylindria bacterium]|nr:VanW family protein [Candidatus Limnocylindria bacterium]
MTTATLPRRFMRPVATAPARRSMLIGFGATLALGLLLLLGMATAIGASAGANVLRGVTVGGVPVGGLTRAQAAEHLVAQLPSLAAGEAVIRVADMEQRVAYADLGRGYDMDAMLDSALSVGRGGNPLADGISRLRTLAHATALPVVVHAYDDDALASISASVAEAVSHPPVEGAVLRDGTAFTVRTSELGIVVDAETVSAALAAAVDSPDPADVVLELSPATVAPIVDTEMAETAAAAATAMVDDLELGIPGADQESLPLDAETIASWISFGPEAELSYTARLDTGAVATAVGALAEDINQDAINAQIAVGAGGGLGGVIAGQEGRALNVDETVAGLVDALKERAAGGSVASLGLAVDVTEPSFTTAEAEAQLPQMQMISSWTTYYVPGDGNGYGNNINIPARDIDGRNLAPGETFSFWGSIGPVTVERGFQYGGVIIGGRSVAGGAIGGGICSTSTTIFNAALRAGLEMGVRANHYYYIDRYPDGLDATVYMDDNFVQDMTFTNDTDNVIVIRGFGGNGFVTFQLWSIPTGRSVVITNPVTSNHRVAADTTVVDGSMAPGTSRRVEYPHNGHDVSRTRYVYDANGNLIHQNTYFSSYRTVNGIVAVGPAVAVQAAPEPPPPAPPADGGAGDAPPPTEPAPPPTTP